MGNVQACCPPPDGHCRVCGSASEGVCCDDIDVGGKPRREVRYNLSVADSQLEEEKRRRTDVYTTGGHALHIAAFLGNENQVLDMVQSGVNVDVLDDLGRTPFMMAGKYGRVTTAKLLVKLGADVDAMDNNRKRLSQIIRKPNPVHDWLERYKATGHCSPINTYFGKQAVWPSRYASPRPLSLNSNSSSKLSSHSQHPDEAAKDPWKQKTSVLQIDLKVYYLPTQLLLDAKYLDAAWCYQMTPAQHRAVMTSSKSPEDFV